MAWEHRYCGTVYDSTTPPLKCEFCASLIRVTHGRDRGWLKVGPAGAEERPFALNQSRRSPKAQKKAEAKERKRVNRRRKISKKKRERIYKRDGWKCVRCGERNKKELTLDHVIPVSRGGSDNDDNLQTMCKWCNNLKGSKTGGNGMRWPSEREMKRAGLIP